MKNLYKYICCILVINLFSQLSNGQDLRFSQYHYTPFLTNPGMLGDNDDVRLLLNYRRQNAGTVTFSTPMLSVNYPLINQKTGNRWGGLGATVISDHIGNVLQDNGVMGGFAYQLNLGKSHLGMGVQAGYFQRSLNLDNLTTDSQFQNGVFTPVVGTGETMLNSSRTYISGGGGLQWYANNSYEEKRYYLGLSAYNFNQPNIALGDGATDKMPMVYVASGGVRVLDKEQFSIMPNVRYVNRLSESQVQAGSWFRYHQMPKENHRGTIGVGAWYHSNEWLILSFEMEQPKYILAVSYDLPMSSNARVSQGNGTIEFTLGLKLHRKTKQKETEENEEEEVIVKDTTIVTPKDTVKTTDPINPVDEPQFLNPEEEKILEQDINFEYNSSTISEDSRVFLDKVAKVLKEKPKVKVILEGHTCNIGKEEENLALSRQRAEIVKDYLTKQGVNANQLEVTGLGEAKPLVPNDSDENRQKNRRVEFMVKP